MKKLFSLAMSIAILSLNISFANIIVWSGNVNSEWHNAGNWSGGVLPGSLDEAVIPNGSNIIVSTQVTIAKILFNNLGSNTTLFMISPSGNMSINGASPLVWGQNCTITNNGIMSLNSPDGYFGAMMLVEGSQFDNNGTLNVTKTDSSYGGGIFMVNGSVFNNNNTASLNIDSCHIGVYIWDDGAPVSFNNNTGASITMTNIKQTGFLGGTGETGSNCCSSIQNDGSMNISTNYPYSAPLRGYGVWFLTANHCFTNGAGGSLTVTQANPGPDKNDFGPSACSIFVGPMALTAAENNNNFAATNGGLITISQSSKLTGNGKVSSLALDIHGNVDPDMPGVITFIDDFAQPNVKAFLLEIGGTNGAGIAKGNDHVEFQGTNAVLSGDLYVSLENSFVPYIGDEFVLFKNTHVNGSITDQLTNISLPGGNEFWEINSLSNQIKIKLVKQLAPCDQNAHALPIATDFISPSEVELSWDKVPEVDHFEIKGRQISPTISPYLTLTASATATSMIIPNLDPHNSYEWMVRPHCDVQESVSGPWSVINDFVICKNPPSTTTIDVTPKSAELNWTPVETNEYGYRIFGSIIGSQSSIIIDVPNPVASTYTIQNLKPSTKYHWMVLQNCGMNVFSNAAIADVNIFQTLSAKTLMEESDAVTIFPNPASNYLNISGEVDELIIYDMKGSEIMKQIDPSGSINISSLEQGFYMIELINQDRITTDKFLINR